MILINHAMANKYWPHEDAVGKRIAFDDNPKEKDWLTVVGIVGDVKDQPNSPGAEPAFWWPELQAPQHDMSLVVRAKADPLALVNTVRNAVGQLDPPLAVADIRLMDQIADTSVATPRLAFLLVGLFAGLAIVLAVIGTYGVISYSVTQRSAEFGLRIALGAQRQDVVRLVLAQASMLVLAGTGSRHRVGFNFGAPVAEPDIRGQPIRSAYVRDCWPHRTFCCNAGLLHSCATSHEVRSHDCLKGRIARSPAGPSNPSGLYFLPNWLCRKEDCLPPVESDGIGQRLRLAGRVRRDFKTAPTTMSDRHQHSEQIPGSARPVL